jgi:hypothetical protein
MRGRALILVAVLLLCLTGCQTVSAGSFTRTLARADVASWTRQAVDAVKSPPPAGSTKSDAFETCRSDNGYFTTLYQWRTITNVDVPLAQQPAATRAIEKSFQSRGWTVSHPTGLVSLAGPRAAKRRGLITIQTAGDSQLAISVISPCYS